MFRTWLNDPCCHGDHHQPAPLLGLSTFLAVFSGTFSRMQLQMGWGDAFGGNSMLVHDKPTYPCVETPKAPSLSKHQHTAPQSSTTGSLLGTGPEDLVDFSRCASPHSCCTLIQWWALFLFELQQLLALGRSTSGRIGKEAATLTRTQFLLALLWYSFLPRLAYRTVITNSMELSGKNKIHFK